MIILIALIHLFVLINVKFTAWPEMFFWPYLIINNWLPYQDFAIVHTPTLVLALSAFYKVFGVGILQLKTFTWLIVLLTDFLLYFIATKLWNNKKSVTVITLVVYVLLQVFNDGNGLWFETALAPLSLVLFYTILKGKYFISGVIWALMLFTKQTAIWFFMPIIFSLFTNKGFVWSSFVQFAKGFVYFTFSSVVLLWSFGILDDFYKWAVSFGVFVLPNSQGQIQLPNLRTLFIVLLPYIFFVPFVLKKKHMGLWLLSWTVSGAMGAYPRFEYFHLQPSLSFLAISFTYFFIEIYRHLKIPIYISVGFALFVAFVMSGFVIKNIGEGVRFYEKDVIDVSEYVKNKTDDGQKIFIINYWDSIYALSDRMPAVDLWIPQLSWYLEIPGVQEEMVISLQKHKPSLVVLKPYTKSGLSSYRPEKLYSFLTTNYEYKESVSGIDMYVERN